jgi:hypothetical protein
MWKPRLGLSLTLGFATTLSMLVMNPEAAAQQRQAVEKTAPQPNAQEQPASRPAFPLNLDDESPPNRQGNYGPRIELPPSPCRTKVVMLRDPRPCEVSIWPINFTLGYGAVFTSHTTDGGLFVGLQAVTLNYKHLFWNGLELLMALSTYRSPDQGSAINSPVMFAGTRPGFALRLGDKARHHIVLSAGLGWGEVYLRKNDPQHTADGLVISPALRYAYRGIFGLEVQAYLPAYSGIVGEYPVAITVNTVGLPLAVFGAMYLIKRL